jgi:hypothetical protein
MAVGDFGDVDLLLAKPADGVLHTLAREVERVLMGVEAEARRIGLFK